MRALTWLETGCHASVSAAAVLSRMLSACVAGTAGSSHRATSAAVVRMAGWRSWSVRIAPSEAVVITVTVSARAARDAEDTEDSRIR